LDRGAGAGAAAAGTVRRRNVLGWGTESWDRVATFGWGKTGRTWRGGSLKFETTGSGRIGGGDLSAVIRLSMCCGAAAVE